MIVKCNKSNEDENDKYFAVFVPTKFEITDMKPVDDKLLVFYWVNMNEEIRITEFIDSDPKFSSNKDKLFAIKDRIEISNDRSEPDHLYLDEKCWKNLS